VVSDRFDREYFDHWYRAEGFGSPARLRRKVTYAVGAAEYLLERQVRTVLDVGAGEGAWYRELRRQRPHVRYVGIDPSAYVVERYGSRRNLRLGGLADLDRIDVGGPFDLVVCADVIAYVGHAELRRGLAAIAALLRGVALIEVFTSADRFEGDLDGYNRRAPATYDRWFAEAGLARIGPHLYASRPFLHQLAAFERS
jgi:SAM-dependent methyltransferase